jgi:acyl carrier protein
MSDIAEKVKSVIAEQMKIKPEEITENAKFTTDLSLDSLDMVELIIELEEGWGIEIPDEDAKKLTTIDEAIKYIEEKIASK